MADTHYKRRRSDLGEVTLELSDFVADKSRHTIPRQNVEAGIVRCWPQRAVDRGGKGEYQIVPERIEIPTGRVTRVASREAKQWWLTVRVPENTPPGRYRMALTLRPQKAPPTILEWRLLVLPFEVIRPADKHWGTWLESFPPVGGLRGSERRGRNTSAEQPLPLLEEIGGQPPLPPDGRAGALALGVEGLEAGQPFGPRAAFRPAGGELRAAGALLLGGTFGVGKRGLVGQASRTSNPASAFTMFHTD